MHLDDQAIFVVQSLHGAIKCVEQLTSLRFFFQFDESCISTDSTLNYKWQYIIWNLHWSWGRSLGQTGQKAGQLGV